MYFKTTCWKNSTLVSFDSNSCSENLAMDDSESNIYLIGRQIWTQTPQIICCFIVSGDWGGIETRKLGGGLDFWAGRHCGCDGDNAVDLQRREHSHIADNRRCGKGPVHTNQFGMLGAKRVQSVFAVKLNAVSIALFTSTHLGRRKKNKKVLLGERKRHTARRVASARYTGRGGTPSQVRGGYPSQVQGVSHPRSGGYPIPGLGGTPSQVQGGTPS